MKRRTISNATTDAINRAARGERVPAFEREPDLIRCAYCSEPFDRARKTQKFCSTKCRVYYHRNMNEKG